MRKLPAIVALLAGLVSCVGVDQNLGGDFIPTDQKYDFHTAEFDLDEVWMKSIDSLTALCIPSAPSGTRLSDFSAEEAW